jgi:release factor glutamine methyltransferase
MQKSKTSQKVKNMTVKDVLAKAISVLIEKKVETPAKEAGVLLAYILKKDASWLYAHPEFQLSAAEIKKYDSIVSKRSKSMPFQYIVNNQEFMSLDFYVNPYCLIPRPETEILVEAALAWINESYCENIRVLDIGTGSGAICVSIAHYAAKTIIDALDVSGQALQIAETNAKRHNVEGRIRFINADFLQWKNEEPYSVILSNPPYIPHNEISMLMSEVKDYEPLTALDGGSDGLLFYRYLASEVKRMMTLEGTIFVEVGIGQAECVVEMFTYQGLKTSVYKDFAGIDRVVQAFF